MAYTKARVLYALAAFNKTVAREKCPTLQGLQSRTDYNLRRATAAQGGAWRPLWADDESSGDEYNPKVSKKRRLPHGAPRPSKKAKRASTTSDSPSQENGTVSVDSDATALHPFLTLRLESAFAKLVLRQLSSLSGSGYLRVTLHDGNLQSGSSAEHGEAYDLLKSQTYLEQLDIESNSITDPAGRVLRTRTVPNLEIPAPQAPGPSTPETERDQDEDAQMEHGRDENAETEINHQEGTETEQGHQEDDAETEQGQHQDDDDDFKDLGLPTPNGSSPSTQTNGDRAGEEHEPSGATSRPTTLTPAQLIRSSLRSGSPARQYPFSKTIPGSSAKHPIIIPSPSPSPSPSPPPPSRASAEMVTIFTHWAHPIDFLHVATAERPCHFCADPLYGVRGYGRRRVHVIRSPDSTSLEETGDGWRSHGRDATRMCISCSLKRLYISRCVSHVFDRLHPAPWASSEAAGHADPADPARPREGPGPSCAAASPLCSLCIRPAVQRCCADQTLDRFGRRLAPGGGLGLGCGLVLCETCWNVVRRDGKLRRWLSNTLPRADKEFLFPGSPLHEAFDRFARGGSASHGT